MDRMLQKKCHALKSEDGVSGEKTVETEECLSCLTAAEQIASAPESKRANALRHFSPRDGSHRQLSRFVQNRLRVPESYEHIATHSCCEGGHLHVLTTFKAMDRRGDYRTEHMVASIAADGAILSVTRI